MNWSGKKVLVTGAGGFIGSHLAERLVSEGACVTALVHYNALGSIGWLEDSAMKNEMRVVAGDICDSDSLSEFVEGMDTVFHLAALIAIPYSYRAPASYVTNNVCGTLNIARLALRAGVRRFIHTSTSEVYGTAQFVPITEEHPLRGQSPYSASKIGADKIVESFHLSFGLPAVIVRPFNTYGPRQSTRAVIPSIIAQCLKKETIILGDTETTRDMNFVHDTVQGFLCAAAAEGSVGGTFNIGSGKEISIGGLARMIAQICGVEAKIQTDAQRLRPTGSEVRRLLADSTRAHSVLGWQPKVTLEQGLALTVEWFRSNGVRGGEYRV